MKRRDAFTGALGLALALRNSEASAQAVAAGWQPRQPVRLIVPFAPGGATDAVGRILASKLEAQWPVPVVVENRAGAGTTIATALVARAAPDGHTVLLAPAPLTITPFLYPTLPYDVQRDLAPVTKLMSSPMMLVAGPRSGLRQLADLRSARGLACGTSGNGSLAHLLLELVKAQSGLDITHVPYRGAGPAMAALASGDVQLTWGAPSELSAAIQGGAVPLALTSPVRMPGPQPAPIFAEAGMPGVSGDAWYGLVAPAGTPRAAVLAIHAACVAALGAPDVLEALARQGMVPDVSGPDAFARFIAADLVRWEPVVRGAQLKVD
ncbi:Bug family tripartite tricarboxylate transporter substrate binding protein [Falsiroseomonas sp. HC035]|uniref:Bug family tripartite tricarboxylate transporter substrate binding protein n=1 Tax=Falsiroseomonas sp. HC035 TaxID=3390999 RepID=UPI003D31C7FE